MIVLAIVCYLCTNKSSEWVKGNEKEFLKLGQILGWFGVFPYIMHTIPKSPYLKSFCNIPQNITCNVFQSISKPISLNIVGKFGEIFCNSIVSD